MKKVKQFFKNVIGELKKTKWPEKKDMIKYTIATIVFIILLSAFFYGVINLMAYLMGVL